MAYGINTYDATGKVGFSANYNPFNVVQSIIATSTGSYTYNPPFGRSVSYVGAPVQGGSNNYWVVTQSGNTVYWTKNGNPPTMYLYIITRG